MAVLFGFNSIYFPKMVAKHLSWGEEEVVNNQDAFKNLASDKQRKYKFRRTKINPERIKAIKIK